MYVARLPVCLCTFSSLQSSFFAGKISVHEGFDMGMDTSFEVKSQFGGGREKLET
jgi:hypothetical protein